MDIAAISRYSEANGISNGELQLHDAHLSHVRLSPNYASALRRRMISASGRLSSS